MEKIKNVIQELKENGFKGFTTVKELKRDFQSGNIPHASGVYLVLYPTTEHPQFIEHGTGGFFKDRNPNASIEKLQAKWVENENVIYIGKAEDLNNRVKQYMDFGCGKPVGHYGGRYIWQIASSDNLTVCWKEFENARGKEKEMILKFKDEHNGMLPFANLKL